MAAVGQVCGAGMWRLLGRYVAAVGRLYGGCWAGIWRLLGGYMAAVGRVYGGCWAGIWRLLGVCWVSIWRLWGGYIAAVGQSILCAPFVQNRLVLVVTCSRGSEGANATLDAL